MRVFRKYCRRGRILSWIKASIADMLIEQIIFLYQLTNTTKYYTIFTQFTFITRRYAIRVNYKNT